MAKYYADVQVMMYMLCRGEAEVCHTLLDLGADINGSMENVSPLTAILCGIPSFKTMKLIISNPNLKLETEVHHAWLSHCISHSMTLTVLGCHGCSLYEMDMSQH